MLQEPEEEAADADFLAYEFDGASEAGVASVLTSRRLSSCYCLRLLPISDSVARPLGQQPALNGLRAVAIAAVLLYHAFGLPGGFLGVDVFFVLSGFLITTLLLEEQDANGRISISGFYRRRLRRLGPGFAAAMGLVALQLTVALMTNPNAADQGLARNGLLSILPISNLMRAGGHSVPGAVTALWSLAEEEQFYLVWPVILIVLLHRRVRPGRLCAGLLLVAFTVVSWRFTLTATGVSSSRIFFGPDTHCDGLLIGCALAAARRRWGLPELRSVAAIPAVIVLLAVMADGSKTGFGYAAEVTVAVVATAVVIVAALSPGPLQRSLSFAPIVGLGVVSYGLYLWQGVVFTWAGRSIITAVASVLIAVASYRYVEAPLRRQGIPPIPSPAPAPA